LKKGTQMVFRWVSLQSGRIKHDAAAEVTRFLISEMLPCSQILPSITGALGRSLLGDGARTEASPCPVSGECCALLDASSPPFVPAKAGT
jgi:hypothetical protein